MKSIFSLRASYIVPTAMALMVGFCVFAEEAESANEEVQVPVKVEKAFTPLMRCVRAKGTVQVLRPNSTEWVKADQGRYYPLGSEVKAMGSSVYAEFALGEKATLTLTNEAHFATKAIAFGEEARVVMLKGGRVNVNVPRTLKAGLLKVVAPYFACSNLAGESLFEYAQTGDGDEAVVRCITGSMSLEGRHFLIEQMGVANQIRLRSTTDNLFTSLRGESGDCKVKLDQGMMREKDFDTNETKEVAKTLEFVLSPMCAIKIFRLKSKLGNHMAVSTMTFNPAGVMQNRIAFAEGRANVNSGELITREATLGDEAKSSDQASEDDAETVEARPAPKAQAEAKKTEE